MPLKTLYMNIFKRELPFVVLISFFPSLIYTLFLYYKLYMEPIRMISNLFYALRHPEAAARPLHHFMLNHNVNVQFFRGWWVWQCCYHVISIYVILNVGPLSPYLPISLCVVIQEFHTLGTSYMTWGWMEQVMSHSKRFHSYFGLVKSLYKSHLMGYNLYHSWA